jgi:Zn-dependent membrane protease YugP
VVGHCYSCDISGAWGQPGFEISEGKAAGSGTVRKSNVSSSKEHEQSKDALWWAAMTYVVAALSAIATLMYYVMIYMGRRD